MAGDGWKSIEVCHATPEGVFLETVRAPDAARVREIIDASDLRRRFPAATVEEGNVGIFSRKVSLDHCPADGDRIEVYRPLTLTPNEIRKLRAERRRG